MKRRHRILWALVALMAVVAVIGWAVRSFGHFALTSYQAELRSKGERLTIRELSATYTQVTNDTFSDMTNLVAKLGSPPADVTNFHVFRSQSPSLVAWRQEHPPWMGSNGSTNLSWTDVNQCILNANPVLRQLHEIFEDHAPNRGPVTNFFQKPMAWRETRSAATWLSCATFANLHNGRRQDALANIRATIGLANLHREEFTLVQQMTRVAVAGMAIELTWEALQADGWTDEELTLLQRCWEQENFLAAVQRGLEGEREMPLAGLAAYEQTTQFRKSWSRARPIWPLYRWTLLENDILYANRHIQTYVELARDLNAGRSYCETLGSMQKLDAQLAEKARSFTRFFYLLSLTTVPNFEKVVTAAAKLETKRRLAVTAIALRRYELKYAGIPKSLAALAPEFIRDVPLDCMNAEALRYRVHGENTFALYSVGTDGKDDGGDWSVPNPGSRSGFCEGHDAVWLQPASGDRKSPVAARVGP